MTALQLVHGVQALVVGLGCLLVLFGSGLLGRFLASLEAHRLWQRPPPAGRGAPPAPAPQRLKAVLQTLEQELEEEAVIDVPSRASTQAAAAFLDRVGRFAQARHALCLSSDDALDLLRSSEQTGALRLRAELESCPPATPQPDGGERTAEMEPPERLAPSGERGADPAALERALARLLDLALGLWTALEEEDCAASLRETARDLTAALGGLHERVKARVERVTNARS